MDPTTIKFTTSARKQLDDDDNRGINCFGCLFKSEPAKVCVVANREAAARGMRDCDAVDQFGEVVIYIGAKVDPRQTDLFNEEKT